MYLFKVGSSPRDLSHGWVQQKGHSSIPYMAYYKGRGQAITLT